jgi:hypothetical protein
MLSVADSLHWVGRDFGIGPGGERWEVMGLDRSLGSGIEGCLLMAAEAGVWGLA